MTNTLLDPVRLMVAGSLFGTVRTAAQVAARTGADLAEVSAAIGALVQIGLVDQAGDGFAVRDEGLLRLLRELADPER